MTHPLKVDFGGEPDLVRLSHAKKKLGVHPVIVKQWRDKGWLEIIAMGPHNKWVSRRAFEACILKHGKREGKTI